MRNIHVVATDKPSRLIIYSRLLNEFRLLDKPIDVWKHKRHIYITSDEQPEHNDYYITDGKEIYRCNTLNPTRNNHYKKVILTTDQDLMKDGVQAIDDEFLEWFCKNSSCEFVDVKLHSFGECHFNDCSCFDFAVQKVCVFYYPDYKIIIPKEEPKQYPIGGYATGNYTCTCVTCKQRFFGDKRAVQCEPCATEMVNTKIVKNNGGYQIEEPKQDLAFYQLDVGKEFEQEVFELGEETLFQPIEPPIGDFIFENANAIQLKDGYYYHYSEVCKLIKLQAKKMYSKEEVIEHLNHLIMMPSSKLDGFTNDEEMVTMKWFEQFKKL
jgi:hypothetical protein